MRTNSSEKLNYLSVTINGTTDRSVSGTGLLGIAQFESKMNPGEYAAIRIGAGYVVDFAGTRSAVSSYTNGIFYFAPPVHTVHPMQRARTGSLQRARSVEVAVYDLRGRAEAVLFRGAPAGGSHSLSLGKAGVQLGRGFHVRTVRCGGETGSAEVGIGR
jgi:hypothetical protein